MDNLDSIDLEKDIDKLYELMNDSSLTKKHQDKIKLNKLRNENHLRYYNISLAKMKSLPVDFVKIISQIEDEYNKIKPDNILNENLENAKKTKKTLDHTYSKIFRLEEMIKTMIKDLEKENDVKQEEFSIVDFKHLDMDEKSKNKILNSYNKLIIYNSKIEKDIYLNLDRQLTRKKYIDEILKLIYKGADDLLNEDKKDITQELNDELNGLIDGTNDKIQYLSDLMVEDSEYEESFNDFVGFYNKVIAYDDTNYDNVKQTLEIFKDKEKLETYTKKFEENFIKEREKASKEETFTLENIGLKNIKISLDYISTNYMDLLDIPRKRVIEDIYNTLDHNSNNIDTIAKNLYNIVKYIWNNDISKINEIEKLDNYYILCSNNQFKEPKTEAILLTRNILNRMDNYYDYQIGFICNYNNNVLYITENDDIMSVKNDDLSKLKTPKQIEQEYINFNIINKIALDGFMTNIIGVYFIDDGDKIKLKKAKELSKDNKLPLIVLKKN